MLEDRVEWLRVEIGVEGGAVGAGDAVRVAMSRSKSGWSAKWSSGRDVVVLGRDDHVVGTLRRSGLLPRVQKSTDAEGDVGATGDGEAAAFAEVVLDVDDEQSLGHRTFLLAPYGSRSARRRGAADCR